MSDADVVDGARDFRLMKREMVDAILAMDEYNRFTKGIFGWIGFRTYWLPFENVERVAGKTKWNFWGLLKYATEGILNFSQVPLKLSSWLGVILTFLSFVAVIYIVIYFFSSIYPIISIFFYYIMGIWKKKLEILK